MRPLITAVIATVALAAASAASAAPISVQPLRDAGYAVGLASETGNGCTTWAVSGHGLSGYINDCDETAAGTIASWVNPVRIYEADWQMNHSDQAQAAFSIGAHCYSISRTAVMTDEWRIVGGTTDTTVPGDQLPGLAASLPDLRQADGACPSGTTVVVAPGTTGATNPDGSPVVTAPGAPAVTTAIDDQAKAQAEAVAAAEAAKTAAVRPDAIADANTASADAWTAAVDEGFAAVDAALAARSAGLNALYGLDVAPV